MASSSRSVASAGLRIARRSLVPSARPSRLFFITRAASTDGASSTTPSADSVDVAAQSAVASGGSDRNAYRYSSSALVRELAPAAANGLTPMLRGSQPNSIFKGVLPRVHQALRAQLDPAQTRTALVDRQSLEQLPPGSVLTIESWTSTAQRGSSAFSGVLIAIRRRGLATSLVLRTLVAGKLGVEMRYSLYSPLIKQIKAIARAEAHKKQQGLRRTRRAKLYYLRRDDRRLNAVASMVKAQRQAEEAALERAAKATQAGSGQQQQQQQKSKSKQQKKGGKR